MIEDPRGRTDYDETGEGSDLGAGAGIQQHRRGLAVDDLSLERRLPLRHHEPARLG